MIINNKPPSLYLLLFFLLLQSPPSSAIDFIFNSFNSSSVSLYRNTTIQSSILTLTNSTPNQIGRALYPHKILTKNSSSLISFSTSFIFAMVPTRNVIPDGFVFLFTPVTGIQNAAAAQYLGPFNIAVDGNSSNHVFGVEFDVFQNEELEDIDDNHIGIDVNFVTSVMLIRAVYNGYRSLRLNDGRNYQVWISYENLGINVRMAPVGRKPTRCLICRRLNLSDVFEDEMYVGFTATIGTLTQSHKILSWSFSN